MLWWWVSKECSNHSHFSFSEIQRLSYQPLLTLVCLICLFHKAIEIVLPDGHLTRATATENPEIFFVSLLQRSLTQFQKHLNSSIYSLDLMKRFLCCMSLFFEGCLGCRFKFWNHHFHWIKNSKALFEPSDLYLSMESTWSSTFHSSFWKLSKLWSSFSSTWIIG